MPSLAPQHLQRFIPFDELSDSALAQLLPYFEVHQFGTGKVIFRRGEVAERAYFLLAGKVDLVDSNLQVTHLSGSDETNLLALDGTNRNHRVSAISTGKCAVATISRQHLEVISAWSDLSQSNPALAADGDWLETLLMSELFSHIPPSNIQQLLSRFEERTVKLGEIVVQEGDEATECFVLKEGTAVVTRGQPPHTQHLAALGAGALFGEDALVARLPRSASITMSSDGLLLVLTKDDFDALMKTPVLEFISADDLTELMENSDVGVLVLDVRPEQIARTTPSPYPNNRNIPLHQLRSSLARLETDFVYVVYGDDSAEAAAYILSESGFEVKVLRTDTPES